MNKRDLLYLSLRKQHLIKKAKRLDIVSELCGLQAQFANNPKYALRIRANDYDDNNIQLKSAIYNGQSYYYTDRPEERATVPACIFLAGFDQLVMGYKDRSRFMDERDKHKVITCSGIVYPTIILNGRIQARWKLDRNKLTVTPFNMLSERSKSMITNKGVSLFPDRELEIIFNPTC